MVAAAKGDEMWNRIVEIVSGNDDTFEPDQDGMYLVHEDPDCNNNGYPRWLIPTELRDEMSAQMECQLRAALLRVQDDDCSRVARIEPVTSNDANPPE